VERREELRTDPSRYLSLGDNSSHEAEIYRDSSNPTTFHMRWDRSPYVLITNWSYQSGDPVMNVERGNGSDSAYAEFADADYYGGSAWATWSSAYVYCDTDDGYDGTVVSDWDLKVAAGTASTNCSA
jgi:hypothetical protein